MTASYIWTPGEQLNAYLKYILYIINNLPFKIFRILFRGPLWGEHFGTLKIQESGMFSWQPLPPNDAYLCCAPLALYSSVCTSGYRSACDLLLRSSPWAIFQASIILHWVEGLYPHASSHTDWHGAYARITPKALTDKHSNGGAVGKGNWLNEPVTLP